MSNIKNLSQKERRRILRSRKTFSEREFRLMVALCPDRKSVIAEGDSWFAYPPPNLAEARARLSVIEVGFGRRYVRCSPLVGSRYGWLLKFGGVRSAPGRGAR